MTSPEHRASELSARAVRFAKLHGRSNGLATTAQTDELIIITNTALLVIRIFNYPAWDLVYSEDPVGNPKVYSDSLVQRALKILRQDQVLDDLADA